ncbi:IncA family protein [Chlamydia suis]|uniref:IncA family protein n=1 Tax=Chlamydia suis TaxID=83559 RepID=UPI0009E2FCB1|nr:IncA family protein [Chlamydia suis]
MNTSNVNGQSAPVTISSSTPLNSVSKGQSMKAKILDVALLIIGALIAVSGVLAFVLGSSCMIFFALGIAALVLGSICLGAGLSRIMCRSFYAKLEAQNLSTRQQLRSLSEEKDALTSVVLINKHFLQELVKEVQALECKAVEIEADCLAKLEKNEKELLEDVRLVLSSYTRRLEAAERGKAVLKASLNRSNASARTSA